MPKSSPRSDERVSLRGATPQVPIAEAKNNLSVVRLVPDHGSGEGMAGRRERVEAALRRLRQLGEGAAFVGDLKAIAREGLDGEP